jgi:LysM repeat protein
MNQRSRETPDYLLWSIPLWFVAIALSAYLLFGRGGGDDSGPDIVFATTQVVPTFTSTVAAPTAIVPTVAVQPSPTATNEPPTPTPEPATYTVQAGDTLTLICNAQRPNVPDCVEQIVTLNNLAGANQIAVGQDLQLPAAP